MLENMRLKEIEKKEAEEAKKMKQLEREQKKKEREKKRREEDKAKAMGKGGKKKKQEMTGEDEAVEDLLAGIQLSDDTAEESSEEDAMCPNCSLVPRPSPFFVLQFLFSTIHKSGRARKTGKAWEHLSRE